MLKPLLVNKVFYPDFYRNVIFNFQLTDWKLSGLGNNALLITLLQLLFLNELVMTLYFFISNDSAVFR